MPRRTNVPPEIFDLARAYYFRQTMINRATGELYTPAEAQEYIRTSFPGADRWARRRAYDLVTRGEQLSFVLAASPFSRTFAQAAKIAGVRFPAERVGARIEVTRWGRNRQGETVALRTNTLYVEVGVNEPIQNAMDRALRWAENLEQSPKGTEAPTARFVGPTLYPASTPGV